MLHGIVNAAIEEDCPLKRSALLLTFAAIPIVHSRRSRARVRLNRIRRDRR